MSELIAEAIIGQFGERCPDVAEDCPCCDAWAEYDRLTASEAAREKLAGLLRDFLTAEYESKTHLNDCIDNSGRPYQSQWLADKIAEAEKLLANTSEAHHG